MSGMSGLGRAKRALKGGGLAGSLVPVAVGGVLTVASTLGIRAFVQPTSGQGAAAVFRWAPAIGAGIGALGAALLGFIGGTRSGITAAATSAISAGFVLLAERLTVSTAGGMLAISAGGSPQTQGAAGLAALIAERARAGAGPLGAIVNEPRGMGAGGEQIRLSGVVNPSAFGTPGFSGN